MKTSKIINFKKFLVLFITFLAASPTQGMQQTALNRAQIIAGHILAAETTRAQSIARAETQVKEELSNAEKNEFLRYMLHDEGKLADIDLMNTPTGNQIYFIFKYQSRWQEDADFNDVKTFTMDPLLKDLLFRLLKKEHELKKSGYVTYIHGQRRHYYWPEKLYTILYGIHYKQDVSDFLFAHVHDLRLIERIKDYFNPINFTYIGRKNLCMNTSLFSGPSSAQNSTCYIESNFNQIPVQLSAKDAFDYLAYSEIYQQFSHEIQAIEQEYKKVCKYGNALLIAIPKSKKDYLIWQHPAGCDEFFLPMTYEKGLNPVSGVKIFPLITGDPEKLAELNKREEALFGAIKKVLEKNN